VSRELLDPEYTAVTKQGGRGERRKKKNYVTGRPITRFRHDTKTPRVGCESLSGVMVGGNKKELSILETNIIQSRRKSTKLRCRRSGNLQGMSSKRLGKKNWGKSRVFWEGAAGGDSAPNELGQA